MKYKWDVKVQREIVSEYKKGESTCEIGKRRKMNPTSIRTILVRHGVKLRDKATFAKFDKKFRDAVVDEYMKGGSTHGVAQSNGMAYGTLRKELLKRGVLRTTPYGEMSDDTMSEIFVRWMDGVSQTRIGKDFGISQVKVGMLLRRMGVIAGKRNSGDKHGAWKGGVFKNSQGYVMEWVHPADPFGSQDGHVLQHRLVMMRHLGRALEPHETVHHINGNRADNRIENLQLRNGKHGKGSVLHCRQCGSHDIEAIPISAERKH